jgi:hypothetical protein
VEENCAAEQATDDKMGHEYSMMYNQDQKKTQYVILIAFPLQQWLHKRASMLRYTYIAF